MTARKRVNAQTSPSTAASATSAPAWPSYTGTSQLVGTSPSGRVTVYVDPSLGQQALQNAQDLLQDADRVVTANDSIFGTTGGPVSVIVFALGGATDGTGGADHMGCDYINGNAIEVDASFGNSSRVSALFEAELSECSMNGNLCGESTGEALSRWLPRSSGTMHCPTLLPPRYGRKMACPTSSTRPTPQIRVPTAPAAEWPSSPG